MPAPWLAVEGTEIMLETDEISRLANYGERIWLARDTPRLPLRGWTLGGRRNVLIDVERTDGNDVVTFRRDASTAVGSPAPEQPARWVLDATNRYHLGHHAGAGFGVVAPPALRRAFNDLDYLPYSYGDADVVVPVRALHLLIELLDRRKPDQLRSFDRAMAEWIEQHKPLRGTGALWADGALRGSGKRAAAAPRLLELIDEALRTPVDKLARRVAHVNQQRAQLLSRYEADGEPGDIFTRPVDDCYVVSEGLVIEVRNTFPFLFREALGEIYEEHAWRLADTFRGWKASVVGGRRAGGPLQFRDMIGSHRDVVDVAIVLLETCGMSHDEARGVFAYIGMREARGDRRITARRADTEAEPDSET